MTHDNPCNTVLAIIRLRILHLPMQCIDIYSTDWAMNAVPAAVLWITRHLQSEHLVTASAMMAEDLGYHNCPMAWRYYLCVGPRTTHERSWCTKYPTKATVIRWSGKAAWAVKNRSGHNREALEAPVKWRLGAIRAWLDLVIVHVHSTMESMPPGAACSVRRANGDCRSSWYPVGAPLKIQPDPSVSSRLPASCLLFLRQKIKGKERQKNKYGLRSKPFLLHVTTKYQTNE